MWAHQSTQRYVAHIPLYRQIHPSEFIIVRKRTQGRLECEFSATSIEKEKAYLHISALLDPALFHPVPLCRLPPLFSPWQHFSAIYLNGEPLSPPPSVPPVCRSLPLYKKSNKATETTHFPSSVSQRLLCSAVEVKRQVDLCPPPPSFSLSRWFYSIHIILKPTPSFSSSLSLAHTRTALPSLSLLPPLLISLSERGWGRDGGELSVT